MFRRLFSPLSKSSSISSSPQTEPETTPPTTTITKEKNKRPPLPPLLNLRGESGERIISETDADWDLVTIESVLNLSSQLSPRKQTFTQNPAAAFTLPNLPPPLVEGESKILSNEDEYSDWRYWNFHYYHEVTPLPPEDIIIIKQKEHPQQQKIYLLSNCPSSCPSPFIHKFTLEISSNKTVCCHKRTFVNMGNQPAKSKAGKKASQKDKKHKKGKSPEAVSPTPSSTTSPPPTPLQQTPGKDDDDDCPVFTSETDPSRIIISLSTNELNDDDDNLSITLADTYRTAYSHGLTNTDSYHTALCTTNCNYEENDDDTLKDQISEQLSIDSFELTMPMTTDSSSVFGDEQEELEHDDSNNNNNGDGRDELPPLPISQPPSSVPQAQTSFTLTRKRKVELLASPVDDLLLPQNSFAGRKDSTVSEINIHSASTDSPNSMGQCVAPTGVGLSFVPPRRYASVSSSEDSNVLRKVQSLTEQTRQDKQINNQRNNKFITDKTDFSSYEKFDGKMLLSGFLSGSDDPSAKPLANQFCNFLLSAGILKPLSSEDTTDQFKIDSMYTWNLTQSTSDQANQQTIPVGRLPSVSWPPTDPSGLDQPDSQTPESTQRTLSPEHLPKPGIVPETVSHFESEIDLTNVTNTLSPEEKDLQTLKKEHKDVLDQKQTQHEVNLFSIRGETQETLLKYQQEIKSLQEEVSKLSELVAKQKLSDEVIPPVPVQTGPPPPPPPMPPPLPQFQQPLQPPPYIPPPPPIPNSSGNFPPLPPPIPPSNFSGGPCPPPLPGSGGPPPPPLPTMGGIPGPPPIPGCGPPPPMAMVAKPEVRKKPLTPSVPMKPLYWTRIQIRTPIVPNNPNSGTLLTSLAQEKDPKLWETLDEVSIPSWDDFHNLFSRQTIERKPAKKVEENKPVKLQAMKILDSKRSQNVGILVKSLNIDIEQVKQAIFEFDLTTISLETLEKILESKATEDEAIMLKSHVESSPDVPLDKPDQFLYDLLSIPNYESRIMSLTFQCNYFESLQIIETKLTNLSLVCEQLTSSKQVQKILALILTYGNYMNGGNTARGQADGFTLDILPKLKDVKSKDNNYTFLHFIVNKFIELEHLKDDELLMDKLPIPEPSDIEKASNTNFDELEIELKKLNNDLKTCERRVQKVIDTSETEHLEPFREKMTKFMEQAKAKLKEVEETFNDSKIKFTGTLEFFDFTPKKTKSSENPASEFFSIWTPFASDFKTIWRNEQQKILKEKLKDAQKVVKQKQNFLKNLIVKKPIKSTGLKEKLRKKRNAD